VGSTAGPRSLSDPADATDVAHIVLLARDSGQELAIRSGGHSIYAVSEGGIVLDLSDMKKLEIDVEGRPAWAETGLTAVEYTNAVGSRSGYRIR
jgi:FAD/FMN-containing dehydrogenase